MRTSSLVLAVLALCVVAVSAQAPIPNRPDGWQIGGPVTAPIVIDAFVDLLCPDCAGAWPVFKQLISSYGNKLAFNIHTFPLPYHTYGFTVAQAAHVAVNGGANPAAIADFFFGIQATYWNGPTFNQTSFEVEAALGAQMVAAKFVSAASFSAGMASDALNQETRVSWKYACSRGVLGTPTTFVNGVYLASDPSWTLADWQSVLNPLLAPTVTVAEPAVPVVSRQRKCSNRAYVTRNFITAPATCPAGQPACNYLPGKTECCFAGEMCIPNVGCRC